MASLPLRSWASPLLAWAVLALSPTTCPAQGQPNGRPNLWAVVVGVDGRPGTTVGPSGAEAARRVGAWLCRAGKWDAKNVLLLTDDPRAPTPVGPGQPATLRATRENLDRAMTGWLKERVRTGDAVLLYVASRIVAADESSPAGVAVEIADGGQTGAGWAPSATIEALLHDRTLRADNNVLVVLDVAPSRESPSEAALGGWLDALVLGPNGGAGGVSRPVISACLAPDWRASARAGGFADAFLAALGEADRPRGVGGALHLLGTDPARLRSGFRIRGTIPPDLTLWASRVGPRQGRSPEWLLQRGHARGVASIAFSADGAQVASGSEDSVVQIRSAGDGTLLTSLAHHTIAITRIAISPDQTLLASADLDGKVRVWDRAFRRIVGELASDRGVVELGFLPDSQRLIALDAAGHAWNWDGARREETWSELVPGGTFQHMALADRAGPVALALGGADGTVTLVGADGRPTGGTIKAGEPLARLALSGDGAELAMADEAGAVRIVSVPAGRTIGEDHLENRPGAMLFLPDGRLAACSGERIRLVLPGRAAVDLPAPGGATRLAVSADSRRLAAIAGGTALLWELPEGDPPRSIPIDGLADRVAPTALAFSPDGARLAIGDFEGALRLVDAATGGLALAPIAADRGQVAALRLSPDVRMMLQINREGVAQIWDLSDGSARAPLPGRWSAGAFLPSGRGVVLSEYRTGDLSARTAGTGMPISLAFPRPTDPRGAILSREKLGPLAVSPDGRWLAAGGANGMVAVWDAAAGQVAFVDRDAHRRAVTAVAFSADAKRLLTAGRDRSARLWKVDARGALAPDGPAITAPEPISAAAIDPRDGGRIAIGTTGGVVLLRPPGAAQPARVDAMDGAINALAFAADGKRLFAGSDRDSRLGIWELNAEPRRIRWDGRDGHAERINALAVHPNGSLLASASDDATIRLWDVGPGEFRPLCALSSMPVARDWVAFAPDGLFDGSEAGRRRITCRVGGAVDSVTAERLFGRFIHFELLAEIFRGDRPRARAPLAGLSNRRPPLVRVVSTRKSGVNPFNRAEVEVEVTDQGGGIGEIVLFEGPPGRRDKRISPAKVDEIPGGSRKALFAAFLKEGENPFWVSASGDDRGWEAEPVPVLLSYDQPKLRQAQLYVMTVGVADYAYDDLDLKFSSANAANFQKVFAARRKNSAYQEVHADPALVNNGATRARILARLAATANRTEPQDTLVVFLSGHGFRDEETDRYYYVPHDVTRAGQGALGTDDLRKEIKANGIPAEDLLERLGKARAKNVLLILDTCYAGAASNAARRGPLERSRHGWGGVIIAAVSGDDKAYEADQIKSSLLTYGLLASINALDDRPVLTERFAPVKLGERGGTLVGSWFEAARQRVAALFEVTQRTQDPQIFGENLDFELVPPIAP
ncbi:hypothetical protein TA3x_003549 [Tundrisphaera sp. TA3]|uniref:hypothetical protein n=1 Tax=Tundrisphaera sp. TA3 TaxID=3435775 RepID=UPI003EBD4318